MNHKPPGINAGMGVDGQTPVSLNTGSSRISWGWCIAVFLGIVELAYVLLAVAAPDTARDIVQAMQICGGEALPLTGPDFSGKFRLGPYWFYLISPFACTRNPLLTVGLAVAVISAMKYPLAYVLGRRLVSTNFAILWLPLLALMCWPSSMMIYTHTNGLVTLLLLSLLVLTTLGRSQIGLSAFLFGIVTSLAINLHPSAFPFVFLAVFPLWKAYRENCLASTILLGLVGGLIPFIPVVFAMMQDAGLAEKNSGAMSILTGDSPARIPHYLWQMVTGPISSVNPTVSESGFPDRGLWVIYAAVGILSMTGILSLIPNLKANKAMLQKCFGLMGLTLLFALAVVPIRVYYPYYMLLVAALPFSALLAIGLVQLKRWLQTTALIFSGLLVVIPLVTHVQAASRGDAITPFGKNYDVEELFPVFDSLHYYIWTSVRDFSGSAAMVCESDSAKLHGYLPLQINEGLSLLARGCESGNSTDQSHWLTLPEAVWKEIGRIPGRSAGGNGVFEVLALSAEADRPEFASSYPPYPEINPQTQRTLKITAPAEAFIFLSNLYYFAPLEITEIVLSAGDTQIRHEDEFATLLQCVNCGVEWVEWEITVNAGSLSPLDLVAF